MPPATTALGRRTSRALGTFATLLTTEAAALDRAHALLTAELAAVDAACSRFRRDAELWRVNHARGRPVRVSPLLGEALAVALAAASLTDGDVDPTCGTCLVRLGYDRDFARARRHTSTLRQPASPAPGWRSVEFDPALGEVRVPAGTVLDLAPRPRRWPPTAPRPPSRPNWAAGSWSTSGATSGWPAPHPAAAGGRASPTTSASMAGPALVTIMR
jgi:thiamine biosynthesis lipoprotein